MSSVYARCAARALARGARVPVGAVTRGAGVAARRSPAAAATAAAAAAAVPRRGMSFMDKVTGFIGKKQDEGATEGFQMQRDLLLKQDKFDFETYKVLFAEIAEKSGATGWKAKIPGRGDEQKQMMEQVKRELKILEHFSAEDARDIKNLKGEQKRRIAADSEVDPADIDEVLVNFEQMRVYHAWMRRRQSSRRPLPDSPEEIRVMMAQDPPKMTKRQRSVLFGNSATKQRGFR